MTDRSVWSRASLAALGTRFSTYPIKFIVTIVVAPILGTSNYGIYTFLITISGLFSLFLRFGFSAGARYYVSNKEFQPKDVAFSTALMGFLTGIAAAAAIVFAWQFGLLGRAGQEISLSFIFALVVAVPLHSTTEVQVRLLLGADRFTTVNGYALLNGIAPPVLLLLFVVVAGMGITGAVLSFVVTVLIKWIYTSASTIVLFRPRVRIDTRFVRLSFIYGFKAWLGALATQASLRLDQFLLGVFLAPGALGVYRIAVVITEVLWMIPGSVGLVLFNRIAEMKTTKDRHKLITRIHRVLLLLMIGIAIALMIVCWFLIPLVLGAEFIDARWVIILLMPGTIALVTSRILTQMFSATGKPETTSLIEAIGAGVATVCYLLFIPTLGIAGAGIGTSVAYTVTAISAVIAYRAVVRPEPVHLFLPKRGDVHWANDLVTESLRVWLGQVRSLMNGRRKADDH